jgi:hemophore-related protein
VVLVALAVLADLVVSVHVDKLSTTSRNPFEQGVHMFTRSVLGAGMIAGAMLFGTTVTAAADPPNCTAGDLAGVMAGVSAGTSTYLFTHPDVNAFFTGLKGKPREQMSTEIQAYFDANPQVRDELRAVRQAAADFRDRCNVQMPDGPLGQ